MHIDVAADGGDRRQGAKRIQYGRIADVAGVQNVLDAAQSCHCLRAQQTVRI
jgi:hypothetical protein